MELQHNELKRPAPDPAAALQSETDSVSPSITKRPHIWEPHSTGHLSNAPQRVATILDVLNADCWRHLLDYITVGDIVRSERVSRAWQRMVWEYLAGVHKYQIVHLYDSSNVNCSRIPVVSRGNYRVTHLPKRELFENMIQKMGPFFASLFTVLADEKRVEAIAENCPNLKALKIQLSAAQPRRENVQLGALNKCRQLNCLSIDLLHLGNDDSLSEIVTLERLEELIILKQHGLTGKFLTNLRANLKTLCIYYCDSLLIENVRSVADRLTGLARLELGSNSIRTLQDSHLLLDKTPNLERLGLENYEAPEGEYRQWIKLGSEVPTAIGRLSRLRVLRLRKNRAVTDEWLAIVARGCPALRCIDVGRTAATARGLRELCRTRPELEQLMICTPFVNDEDLVACARYCGSLELLELSYCYRLTTSLPARLAWPRPRPLRLRMFAVSQGTIEGHYEGITLLQDRPRYGFWRD